MPTEEPDNMLSVHVTFKVQYLLNYCTGNILSLKANKPFLFTYCKSG